MDAFEKYPDLNSKEFVDEYDFMRCWTVENPSLAMSELDVAVALLATEGNLTRCAQLLHRSRRTTETFVTRNLMLSDLADDISESFLDAVEESYRSAARLGDNGAMRFFLSTKGKNRGYNTRSEVTGANGSPLEVEVSPRAILLDKLARIRAGRGTDGDDDGDDGAAMPSATV